MARQGLTIALLAQRSGLDERTIKSLLRGGGAKPHARTLHRLSEGLEVTVDELFVPLSDRPAGFDRQTNPAVHTVIGEHPQLFLGWTQAEFDELYSRVGTGGPLTPAGALEAAEQMNQRREALEKVALLLETGERQLLLGMIDLLYQRVVLRQPSS